MNPSALREGSAVDIKECDEGAAWCAVTHEEKNGFVSGRYLVQTEPAAPSWPRTFTNDAGASLTMYQPQVTDWPNFSQLEALIAAELKTSADAKPVYGVIGVSAKSIADDEADEVTLSELKVTRVEFSTLSKEQLAKVALEVGKSFRPAPSSFRRRD